MTTEKSNTLEFEAGPDDAGMRLDVFLAGAIEDASRSFLQKVIKDQRVSINEHTVKRSSRTVVEGSRIVVNMPPPPPSELIPENIPIDVLHEDEHILIVNKASGMVVHPAPGHYTGTLVHAVLFHSKDFERPTGDLSDEDEAAVRPGIVHRLDRYTSGVMVVAKSQKAFNHLAKQAREHTFDRHYVALVRGEFKEDAGLIDASIGRSLVHRGKMAVTSVKARDAVTHFNIQERFTIASKVKLELETGRTHQIRVHLRFAGRPILGDPVYGVTDYSGWTVPPALLEALHALEGQALHAEMLGLEHPATGERLKFTAPPPADFQLAENELRAFAKS